MTELNHIADEIRELRRSGMEPAEINVEAIVDTDAVKALERMAVALERSCELQAATNDLLAMLILDHKPRPRTRSETVTNFAIIFITVSLVAVWIWQVVAAVRGG